MSELTNKQFTFTEYPDWKLEDRYQELTQSHSVGERHIAIVREMAHILFELGQRVSEEVVV